MKATLVSFQGAWLALCVFGWLSLSFSGGQSVAECEAAGGFFCLSTGVWLLILGLYGLVVWIAGAAIIALVWGLARWLLRRSPRVGTERP